MAIIHRIGTPENDSEARAIKRFAKELPDECFVFHNFEVTTGRGLPYEYDIAVLTPHALYHLNPIQNAVDSASKNVARTDRPICRALLLAVLPIDPVNIMGRKILIDCLSDRREERMFAKSSE